MENGKITNGKITREGQMRKVQDEGLELFSRKNRDYGDAFIDYGVIGILVRLGDKIRRAQSITSKEVALVDTESIRDTLIDLHNYAAMAIMIIDEQTDEKTADLNKNEFSDFLKTGSSAYENFRNLDRVTGSDEESE